MTDSTNSGAFDMDGSNFETDAYVNKVLKECSLKDVMNVETVIIRDTQALHSDMQTLVYENYNKFISATDTMRKMKTEFKQMETEMNLLVSNVKSITEFSDHISSKLHDSRQQLSALSEKQLLLQKLQFLSSLPTKLKTLIDDNNYGQAVKHYSEAHTVLEQYGFQPSFQGIRDDCQLIMDDLKTKLKTNIQLSGFTAKAMIDTGDLLLKLGEKPADLSREILQFATQRLHEQIVILQDQTDRDMIDFVDMSIKGFINDLVLIVSSYTEMFLTKNNSSDYSVQYDDLNSFVTKNLEKYSALVQVRVEVETGHGDYNVLLQALDRLYRKLLAMKNLSCDIDMTAITIEIIVNAAIQLCNFHLKNLKESFSDSLSSIRLHLVTASKNDSSVLNTTTSSDLLDLVNRLYVTTSEKIKVVIQDLLIFIKPEWSFEIRSHPKGVQCIEGIRENLVVDFLKYIATTMTSYSDINLACPPNLLLVFSKMCLEMEQIGVKKLILLVDELYGIDPIANPSLTHENTLYVEMRNSAQTLLDSYVRSQGLNISQMLRKSVETRDWLNCLEPRSVRAVMKRVVDELTSIENVIADLYESGAQTAASSDSSRKTHFSISASKPQYRSNWSNCTPANLEPMIVTNMHRLFSDKIDIFGSVQFTKVSILTGIIKLCLKTLLECVRLRTFSKFGLQQIQVDAHYLQMNLWRFVADENVMHYLLDEILGSAVHRCLEPTLMEPTAVGLICEQIH